MGTCKTRPLLELAYVRCREPLDGTDALGVVLEEALVRGHSDVVAALGSTRAQPRPLAAREQQCRNLAFPNELQAMGACCIRIW